MQTHETFDRKGAVAAPSERAFGLVIATFVAIVGAYRVWRGHGDGPFWLAAAAAFATLAAVWSAPLRPLNRAWMAFGALLHVIVSPVVLGLVFVLTIVPTGVLMRLLRKDPLRLRRDPSASTYWIVRDTTRVGTMRDQF